MNSKTSQITERKFTIRHGTRKDEIKEQIQIFTDIPFKIEEWSVDQVWHLTDEDCYSDWLKEEIRQLNQIVIHFIKEGYQSDIGQKYDHSFLRKLVYHLSEFENILDALKLVNGWNNKTGLELAASEIRIYHKKNHKIPISRGKGMNGISSAIRAKYWNNFGINSWDDLLKYSIGGVELQKIRELERREIFDTAKLELKQFFETKKRLPTSHDKKLSWIVNSINSGKWSEFGIKKWNDLLVLVFGDTNKVQDKYSGEEGLKIAIQELKDYKQINGQLPRSIDFSTIAYNASNDEWGVYGIHKWNDLMKYVFGEVYYEKEYDFTTKETINKIKQELREFREKYGRIPKSTDEEISKISSASRSGTLRKWGVHSWNDLLMQTFSEINLEQEKYVGKQGIKRAIQELNDLKNKFGRIPTQREIRGVENAILDGRWKEYGITSWNDLLFETFGEVNLGKGNYRKQERLEEAISELKEYEKTNKKRPCSNLKQFYHVCNTIGRGDWKEFGINSWNDLMEKIFGTVNIDLKKYLGKTGLERAIKHLEKLYEHENKIPTSHSQGVRTIQHAIARKEWEMFGINSWNDLLKQVFGKINRGPCKYHGKIGLKNAIKELKSYYHTHGEKPTAESFPIMFQFIRRSGWKEFKINKWKDLLIHIFGNTNSKRTIYSGSEGFEVAIQKVREYEKSNKKKPSSSSKGMRGISKRCNKGDWAKQGIRCWKDFLDFIFES